jgi:hypothetical protein
MISHFFLFVFIYFIFKITKYIYLFLFSQTGGLASKLMTIYFRGFHVVSVVFVDFHAQNVGNWALRN